ncbi:membrane protease YdiL (CAAX protease family) [Flavobacterium sp. HSC-32F16]|uniref:CPBP family intramembrane glutamic endopeptidase n=1 Tax=Flavobacterium sp. HSC-32F16 TaxID=2910964 RepID=UPI0020A5F59F|nr:CPBP family intramembrane glutamic endopeptidase [Flavobacterium sp. HSC-32F16]MCP2025377.1 membrane protease YdiL (CAAX protease family) [Flavobacterium sp. HSC-32F16]
MKLKINYEAIAVFYIIAIVCRFIAVKTELFNGVVHDYVFILIRGAGPALGAFIAIKLFSLQNPMSLKGIYTNIALPFVIFWLLPALSITTLYYFIYGKFPIVFAFTVLVYGLLEEIGWRGFLQEQLKGLPKFTATVIIAVLWFVWHLNFNMTSSNLIFFGIIFFGTWGIGKIYSKTNSLIAVAGVHSLNNFFVKGVHEQELTVIVALLVVWIGFVIVYDRKFNKTKLVLDN